MCDRGGRRVTKDNWEEERKEENRHGMLVWFSRS